MRSVAISLLAYENRAMQMILTLLVFVAMAFVSGRADAFELEESLKSQYVQYRVPAKLHAVQADGMSLSQAIQMIRQRTGGQILSAETRVRGGREVHHIKVLKDGTVKIHKVNGRRR